MAWDNTQLPGFGLAPAATYKSYRDISAHPTVALAMAVVKGPIIRAQWSWQKEDGASEDRRKEIEETFEPFWSHLVRDALHALEMAWTPFELVYKGKGSTIDLLRPKPLLWDRTEILVNPGGEFAGLKNKAGEKSVELVQPNAWIYTNDPICGDLYGRSRHENIRKWWGRAEEVAQQFAGYLKKTSGIIFQLHYPDGTSKDASGADVPNFQIARDALAKVGAGQNIAIPNKFASFLSGEDGTITPAALEKALAAAGKSDWVFSFLDASTASHGDDFLSALGYFDKLFFRGWLRPERSGLEATKGGMGASDAGDFTEVGLQDGEMVAWDLAQGINQGIVDELLVAKWGEEARGTIYCEPGPLVDTNSGQIAKIIQSAFQDPNVGPQLSQYVDWKAVLEDVDVPIIGALTKDGKIHIVPPATIDALAKPEDPITVNSPASGKQKKQAKKAIKKLSRAAVGQAARTLMKDGADVLALSEVSS